MLPQQYVNANIGHFSITVALHHTRQIAGHGIAGITTPYTQHHAQRIKHPAQKSIATQKMQTAPHNSLGDGLDVAERSFASTSGDQRQRLVDTAKRRNIDGLNRRYEEAEEIEVLNANGWIWDACLVRGWELVCAVACIT